MKRSQKGSGLIEGVVGLMLVIGSTILAALLLLNSGMSILFDNKLLLVAGQAARYAVAHQLDENVEAETQTFVQSLMPTLGLTPNNLIVTTTPNAICGAQGMQVTVSNQFIVVGAAAIPGVFPSQIRLADTEFAGCTIAGKSQ